ncbi:MAG: hypothetical protein JWN04_3020, partial [Myxococcaceae bacterium]|nr:hypothetical protein [Myxococcaceae bacterium]
AFNGALMPLAICADEDSCARDAVDLQNVATHEIGHFLGLAHSADARATMWCAAERGDHEKRTLESDDELGLCAMYKSGAAFLDQPVAPVVSSHPAARKIGGCSIVPVAPPPVYTSWFTLLFVLVAARSVRRVLREMLPRRRIDPARTS